MAELIIGRNCAYPGCNQLDFLPFPCDLCSKTYCREHKETTSHKCSGGVERKNDDQEEGKCEIVSYKCTYDGCKKGELVSVRCSMCDQQFCVEHRSAEQHNCEELERRRLEKMGGRSENPTTSPTFTVLTKLRYKNKRQEKLATKVALIKLKMCASGRREIPAEARVYWLVRHDRSDHPLYVSREWSVGRALDVIAAHIPVANSNNEKGVKRLHLFSTSDGKALPNHQKVVEVLQNELVFNGSTVVLAYA